MHAFDLAAANLMSPLILCFVLGGAAKLLGSDLKLPEQIYTGISIYLMLAIGLKGGAELSGRPFTEIALPILAALVLASSIPLWSFVILRRLGRFGAADSAAIAAHYGSVSAVTFVAALTYLDTIGQSYEGYMPAILALMEVPAIIIALVLARSAGERATGRVGDAPSRRESGSGIGAALREVLVGKSVVLLVGGLIIGWVCGPAGIAPVKPVFTELFRGVLCLFLLDLGIAAASRLGDFRKVGPFLAGFAVVMPVLHGALGVALGSLAGLGVGGAMVLGALAASASYIAAPAAVRLALPQANPGYYLTASLAITFPFNLTLGLPLYHAMALMLDGIARQ